MKDEEKQELYEQAETLLAEQNFPAAVIAGAVATILAAVAYAMVVATWPISHGFAAAGIGIVVGISMQFVGRGIATKFAVVAAVYTLVGCVLGNLFRVVIEQARGTGTSPIDLIGRSSPATLAEWSMSYVSAIDLVYWLIAVAAAVFLGRRPLSRAQRLAIGMLEMRT